MTYIIIGIIAIGITYFFLKKKESKPKQDDFFISTASQSNNRIEKLGLDKSSEDASHILNENELNIPEVNNDPEKSEYKANSSQEWILNLIIPNGEIVQQKKLYELFDLEWRTNFSSTIFGYSPEDNKWTYALAGGVPETYNKIQIAISLLDVFNDENYDSKKLEQYVTELEKRVKKHSLNFEIEEIESKNSAIEKSKKLVQLKELYNRDILIILQSETEYDGKKIWDTLQSLGLRWGDGDLFHWNNNSNYASDEHFSVWTSTEPEYFLPEQMKEGKMNPSNLIFGFSIPRSADPINVYQILINSIKYCQKKLGGQLINRNGEPFDELFEKKALEKLVKDMIDNEVIPGSDNALRLY